MHLLPLRKMRPGDVTFVEDWKLTIRQHCKPQKKLGADSVATCNTIGGPNFDDGEKSKKKKT